MKREDLKGMCVPVVTPVDAKGGVDFDGLQKVVRYILDGGVQSIFTLGGTGNFPAFTAEQRFEIAQAVVQEVKGEVPVLVGCMDASTPLVIKNILLAAQAGADAVVVEPPFYFPCTDEEVITHFKAVADATDLPIVIYNIPAANKINITTALTVKLAEIPGIVGIKDSASDFICHQQLLRAFAGTDFLVIQGQEPLAGSSFLLKADGGILSIGNVVPKICAQLYQAGAAGKLEETNRLQAQLMLAYDIYRLPTPPTTSSAAYTATVGSFLAGLEAALDLLGICKHVVTVPYGAPTKADYERIKGILVKLGLVSA